MQKVIAIDPGLKYAGIAYGDPKSIIGTNLRLSEDVSYSSLIAEQHFDFIKYIYDFEYTYTTINIEVVSGFELTGLLLLTKSVCEKLCVKIERWIKEYSLEITINKFTGADTSEQRKFIKLNKTKIKNKDSKMAHVNDAIALLSMSHFDLGFGNKPILSEYSDIWYEEFCWNLPDDDSELYRLKSINFMLNYINLPFAKKYVEKINKKLICKNTILITLNDFMTERNSYLKVIEQQKIEQRMLEEKRAEQLETERKNTERARLKKLKEKQLFIENHRKEQYALEEKKLEQNRVEKRKQKKEEQQKMERVALEQEKLRLQAYKEQRFKKTLVAFFLFFILILLINSI